MGGVLVSTMVFICTTERAVKMQNKLYATILLQSGFFRSNRRFYSGYSVSAKDRTAKKAKLSSLEGDSFDVRLL